MAILKITQDITGQVGVVPQEIYIETNDTLATVITPGYLNQARSQGYQFSNRQLAHVYGIDFNNGVPGCLDFMVQTPANPSTGNYTLVSMSSSGEVVLPVTANHIATYVGTTGAIGDDAATAINGGNIQAGLSGTAGYLASFPATAGRGSLRFAAENNFGDTSTIISNAAMGQASTISIPDPGASTASFLLDTGAANVLTEQQFVSLNNLLLASGGTWTMTRLAQGDYGLVHTVADDASVLSFDITPILRAAANKGFRLNSIDVIYSIGALALDAHTMVLDSIAYANNAAVSVTSVPLTGSLATATQASPYVTNLAVTTPAFLITADTKYVVELTVNTGATSTYTLYGMNLRFSQTIA